MLAVLAICALGAAAIIVGGRPEQNPITDARSITWTDLLPEDQVEIWGDVTSRGPTSEAEWLEQEAARNSVPTTFMTLSEAGSVWAEQPQPSFSAETRADLDGVRVALSGYMTPLSFEERETRLFLLVPYVGACIHVPAPPPNQIVIVESADPVPVLDMWQPFTAVGALRIERLDTGLAESAYVMELDRMVAIDLAGGPEEDYTADDYGDGEMQ